jgi:hypothetical protein
MAIAQRTATELKQLVKVQLEDHGIWAYVQVNPCSRNDRSSPNGDQTGDPPGRSKRRA